MRPGLGMGLARQVRPLPLGIGDLLLTQARLLGRPPHGTVRPGGLVALGDLRLARAERGLAAEGLCWFAFLHGISRPWVAPGVARLRASAGMVSRPARSRRAAAPTDVRSNSASRRGSPWPSR